MMIMEPPRSLIIGLAALGSLFRLEMVSHTLRLSARLRTALSGQLTNAKSCRPHCTVSALAAEAWLTGPDGMRDRNVELFFAAFLSLHLQERPEQRTFL